MFPLPAARWVFNVFWAFLRPDTPPIDHRSRFANAREGERMTFVFIGLGVAAAAAAAFFRPPLLRGPLRAEAEGRAPRLPAAAGSRAPTRLEEADPEGA